MLNVNFEYIVTGIKKECEEMFFKEIQVGDVLLIKAYTLMGECFCINTRTGRYINWNLFKVRDKINEYFESEGKILKEEEV